MRYDEQSKKLAVSVSEAVATARRGISGFTVTDEEEPELARSSLPEGYEESERKAFSRDFSVDGIDFSMHGEALRAADGELHTLVCVPSLREAKKKEAVKQARGEAFILGAMYLDTLPDDIQYLRLKTVFLALDTGEVKIDAEDAARAKLSEFFERCAGALARSGRAEIERVTERLPTMKRVKFPYGKARDGQEEFIRAAYRTIARGGRLYGAAPTGTGKTVSALFPAVRALGNGKCDKVFYLTPKQTTAKAAEDCLELLCSSGAKIRSVTLMAKDKLCRRGHVCRESKKLCPTFTSPRMSEAAMALFDAAIATVTPNDVSEFAERFGVCPYELSLTYSELCDVIICDFNYLFDPQVYIRRFFSQHCNFAFLIDEAHNLSERAREMYSADLSLEELSGTELLGELSPLKKASLEAADIFSGTLLALIRDEMREDKNGISHGAYHSRSLPNEFYSLFDRLLTVAEDELYAAYAAKDDEKDARITYIRDYLYKIKKFYSAICRFDDSFEFFAFYDGKSPYGDEDGESVAVPAGTLRAKLFCLDTGGVISSRLDLGKSAVIFSGTLSPISYYRSILGGDRSSDVLTLDSPFAKEQLSVSVMDKITTRYSEREDSLLAVCRVIAATLSARRGNYMIFSPSFAYSEALYNAFKKKYPKIRIIIQTPYMSALEKEEFLAEFSKSNGSYLAAFCVMGGIYSEGIDLAGDKLIGAVIVGIGMPSLSFEREAIAAYYQEKLDAGTEYAYLYPGMNRVLQAAGRVIRTENDRGVIVLIDDRFDDPIYKKIAPSLWSGMEFLPDARILRERLDRFWQGVDEEF